MNILLTNDDGINAPGINQTYHAIKDLADDVMVVAPLTVQSATGHGITFSQPLMTRELTTATGMPGIAVDGRPADCVKVALTHLWPDRFGKGTRPDLVVSGTNMGANVGINVIYSGTVAAAIEAAFLGIPAIALSLHLGPGKANYTAAAKRARYAIDRVLEGGLPDAHACININIPRTEDDDPERDHMPELTVCPMNTHGMVDAYERRVNPAGEPYYWAAGDGLDFHARDAGTDVVELFNKKITVTPLTYDLTRQDQMAALRDQLAASV